MNISILGFTVTGYAVVVSLPNNFLFWIYVSWYFSLVKLSE